MFYDLKISFLISDGLRVIQVSFYRGKIVKVGGHHNYLSGYVPRPKKEFSDLNWFNSDSSVILLWKLRESGRVP